MSRGIVVVDKYFCMLSNFGLVFEGPQQCGWHCSFTNARVHDNHCCCYPNCFVTQLSYSSGLFFHMLAETAVVTKNTVCILSPEVLRVSPFPHNFIHAVMVRVLGGMNMCCFTRFTRFTRCSSTSEDDFLLRLQIANKGLVLR